MENEQISQELKLTQVQLSKVQHQTREHKLHFAEKTRTNKRPAQEISRQRAQVDVWKRKYFDLRKKYYQSAKCDAQLSNMKRNLKKVQTLKTSLCHYYR